MKTQRKFGRRRGSVLLEFAIIMPILLTISLLLVQYGIIMYSVMSLSNLSREGARYAAINPTSDADIKDKISDSMPPNLKYSDLTITVADTGTRVTNSPITVTLSYNMSKKLFLPSTLKLGFMSTTIFSRTFTTHTTMRIE